MGAFSGNRHPGQERPAAALDAGGTLRDLASARIRLLHAFLWRHRAGWSMPPRTLANGIVSFLLHGRVVTRIGDQERERCVGTVTVMPEGVLQSSRFAPGVAAVDTIGFHLRVDGADGDLLRRIPPFPRLRDPGFWRRRLLAAAGAFNAGGEDGPAYAETTLRLLLAELAAGGPPARRAGPVDPRVRRCLHALHEPDGGALGVEDLARLAGLTSRRLRDLFRAATGLAPKAYAQRLRLAEAARRLVTGDEPAARIARDLGFASAKHFHHAFRRAFRDTPANWRRRPE